MKKLIFIGIAALICSSCQFENSKYGTLSEMWDANEPAKTPTVTEPVTSAEGGVVSEPKTAVYTSSYPTDLERYRQNVVVKAAGENYIIFEYSDVRVDEVASLASHYCYENDPQTKAFLRDIYMYRNHKRRATFDCMNLASN